MRKRISDQYTANEDESVCVVWSLSGYLDQDITPFEDYRTAFNSACDTFDLSFAAARELLTSGEVFLHRGNSNIDVSAKHSLQYIYICTMYNTELESDSDW